MLKRSRVRWTCINCQHELVTIEGTYCKDCLEFAGDFESQWNTAIQATNDGSRDQSNTLIPSNNNPELSTSISNFLNDPCRHPKIWLAENYLNILNAIYFLPSVLKQLIVDYLLIDFRKFQVNDLVLLEDALRMRYHVQIKQIEINKIHIRWPKWGSLFLFLSIYLSIYLSLPLCVSFSETSHSTSSLLSTEYIYIYIEYIIIKISLLLSPRCLLFVITKMEPLYIYLIKQILFTRMFLSYSLFLYQHNWSTCSLSPACLYIIYVYI